MLAQILRLLPIGLAVGIWVAVAQPWGLLATVVGAVVIALALGFVVFKLFPPKVPAPK